MKKENIEKIIKLPLSHKWFAILVSAFLAFLIVIIVALVAWWNGASTKIIYVGSTGLLLGLGLIIFTLWLIKAKENLKL